MYIYICSGCQTPKSPWKSLKVQPSASRSILCQLRYPILTNPQKMISPVISRSFHFSTTCWGLLTLLAALILMGRRFSPSPTNESRLQPGNLWKFWGGFPNRLNHHHFWSAVKVTIEFPSSEFLLHNHWEGLWWSRRRQGFQLGHWNFWRQLLPGITCSAAD